MRNTRSEEQKREERAIKVTKLATRGEKQCSENNPIGKKMKINHYPIAGNRGHEIWINGPDCQLQPTHHKQSQQSEFTSNLSLRITIHGQDYRLQPPDQV
jgi:hypothetical protein